jgi:hypothetical protein
MIFVLFTSRVSRIQSGFVRIVHVQVPWFKINALDHHFLHALFPGLFVAVARRFALWWVLTNFLRVLRIVI